jgi:amino acid transporter
MPRLPNQPPAQPANPAPAPAGDPPDQPRPLLGLREAVTLIVGIVVGAGIFKAPALVAGMSPSAGWMFTAWLLGGAVSLAGALCYAELSTAYAHAGGDYHFLHRAYGRAVAFLFGWARYAVITTGSIALLAFVFGDYLAQVAPLPFLPAAGASALYAGAAVLGLGLLNLHGLHSGSATQTWLTLVEVGGLLLVAVAALMLPGVTSTAAAAAPAAPPAGGQAGGSFGLAMVFVLLTYGGWNEAAYLSAEVRDGAANMVRSLVLAVLIVTGLYLLVTWGYWHGLGKRRRPN